MVGKTLERGIARQFNAGRGRIMVKINKSTIWFFRSSIITGYALAVPIVIAFCCPPPGIILNAIVGISAIAINKDFIFRYKPTTVVE
jgi:hypothetical protein